jgi:hypothetical protein
VLGVVAVVVDGGVQVVLVLAADGQAGALL